MQGEVAIRPAKAADVAAIRALLVETWHDTYDQIYGPERVTAITDVWHSVQSLSAQVDSPASVFLVATLDGQIVATSKASTLPDGSAHLSRLYVLPAAQRLGIGLKLFNATIAGLGHPAVMTLQVQPKNVRAIAFYERLGFQVTGSVAECGGTGSGAASALVMIRFT